MTCEIRIKRMSQAELLTVQQTAEEVQVTAKTVRHWIKIGELPAVKLGRTRLPIGGQAYHIKRVDLEGFIIYYKAYRGFIQVEHSYYRLAVLDKYRNDPAKYYLHEHAYSGKLGILAPRHWLHISRRPRLRINKSDFCEIYFNKVPLALHQNGTGLATGEIVVRLMYTEFDKLQCQKEEPIHWSNFVIQNPALGTKFGGCPLHPPKAGK
jgi:excisionase family DNA binding protein